MNKFEFSILKYRHSFLLGEEVNVGLLFYFGHDQSVEFLYPNSLQRITSLYPDFSYKTVKKYFRLFDKQTKTINKKLTKKNPRQLSFHDKVSRSLLTSIIREYFLKKDSSSFYFTETQGGVSKLEKDQILDYYYEQYLSLYDLNKDRNRKDEKYLLDRIESEINRESPRLENKFQKNIKVENDYFSETFDFAWKNGSLNLITPIGFDLKEENSIKEKGYRWSGKLSSLSDVAKDKDYKFDLVVSRPTVKNLFKIYDKALKLVDESDTPKRIIEENEIGEYIDKARNYLLQDN